MCTVNISNLEHYVDISHILTMSKSTRTWATPAQMSSLNPLCCTIWKFSNMQQCKSPKPALQCVCKSSYISRWFFYFFLLCTVFNTALSVAPQIPLCRRMLGSYPGLLRLRLWQSDALTARLSLIPNSARSHPQSRLDLILIYIFTTTADVWEKFESFCCTMWKNLQSAILM